MARSMRRFARAGRVRRTAAVRSAGDVDDRDRIEFVTEGGPHDAEGVDDERVADAVG